MTKEILVVCNTGVSSRFVAQELALAFEEIEADSGLEMEEFDFNPRGVLSRLPTDDEIESASAILVPFSQKDLSKLEKNQGPQKGPGKDSLAAWKKFFERIAPENKPVLPCYDFERSEFVEPKELAERILAVIG
ncbi:MAG: hypothetical protein V1708_05950 [Candidatus Micrarchaeota archaeon]